MRAVRSWSLFVAVAGGAACAAHEASSAPPRDPTCASPSKLAVSAQPAPPKTTATSTAGGVHELRDDAGALVASFTVGARTVVLRGATRTFAASDSADRVDTAYWVRVLPAPFAGDVDAAWVATAMADTSPDALAVAAEYLTCAAVEGDGGHAIAGTAHYGPLESTGDRTSGADFNDYLGTDWTFPSGSTEAARPSLLGALDCSGFMRIVWGYRLGVPLDVPPGAAAIPRRSYEILESAPGVVVVPSTGAQIVDLSPLLPGDLVFFDARADDGPRIDHVGMFVGVDSGGHQRFVSSRKSADGPTLGDYDGPSRLDGDSLFARSFRAARRL